MHLTTYYSKKIKLLLIILFKRTFLFEEIEAESRSDDGYFISNEDEQFHKTVKKIVEGVTSIVYKIIDTRNDQLLCKKVMKIVFYIYCKFSDTFIMINDIH